MTDALRIYAAYLLDLAADEITVGDGLPLDELAAADRAEIEAAIRADPLYDPDGADRVWPGVEGLPAARVYRAVAGLVRARPGTGGPGP